MSFDEAAFVLQDAQQGDFSSNLFYVRYNSLTTPNTWLEHDMRSGIRCVHLLLGRPHLHNRISAQAG